MKELHEGDLVSFDISVARGVGWVVKAVDEHSDIKAVSIKWDDDFIKEKDAGSASYLLHDIPFDNLVRIDEKDWDNNVRLDYVKNTLFDEKTVENLTEDGKKMVRRQLEILCEHGNRAALIKKGYLCYGGSPIYECDWNETERCFKMALESGLDTSILNSLGYIYYYGRTNGGVPDYEKAYKCFSLAALDGNHESLYKTGDMLLRGLGVPLSEELADKLYYRVYSETRSLVLNGYSLTSFADAALRMAASYSRRGFSGGEIYGKYLEADLGLRIRSWERCYGDDKVRKSVEEGLEKYSKGNLDVDLPDIFFFLDMDNLMGNLLRVTLERKGKVVRGSIDIISGKTGHKAGDAFLLLTLPVFSYCGFVRSFSFKCTLIEKTEDINDGENMTIHSVGVVNDGNSEVTFIGERGPVTLNGESWTIKKPGKRNEFTPKWKDRNEYGE